MRSTDRPFIAIPKFFRYFLLITVFGLAIHTGAVMAATLAGWDMHGLSGYGPSPMAATVSDPNLTVVGLTRGAGVGTSGSAAARAWGGNGWNVADAAAAISGSKFATLSIMANSGYRVSYSSIARFDYRRSSTGPNTGLLQYQLGGGAFTDIAALSYSSTSSSGASLAAIDLSAISALQNVPSGTAVTFRIVNFGATSSGGTWYIFDVADSIANDFEIQGTVTEETPGTFTLTTAIAGSGGGTITGVANPYTPGSYASITAVPDGSSTFTAWSGCATSADPTIQVLMDANKQCTANFTATQPGGPFTIFHMNDAHSRLLPHEFDVPEMDDVVEMEMVGGAAYFASRMLALKAAEPDSLILDAGDISEGNPLGDLRGNGGIIDFYNLLHTKLLALGGRGIDAVVVGNHDVRSRQMLTNLKPVAEGGRALFKGISMNVCEHGTTTPYFDPYAVVTVNGTRVGILGYTNDESSYLGADLVGVVEVKKCTWDGAGGTINISNWVNTLRTTEACDVVILLSHMGQSRVTAGTDALIADSGGVEPPEIVISGHWHTWTERVWRPSNMNGKTIVAEAASYLQYIGELAVDAAGDYVQAQKHVIRNSQITPDADIQTLIGDLTAEYNGTAPPHALDEIIGYSAVDLTLDKDKWWTVSEYPWNATNAAGAWICDAMVWKAADRGFPVHLALQSGGGIRRDIAKGEITYVEIYEAYPWSDDNMIRVQMTGQEIWNWIQTDYVGTSISDGWHVTAHDGQITGITYQGNPINLSGTYDVAISEYMFAHPEIALSDTTPDDVGYSIREGVVDFTAQYDSPENPMYPTGIAPRYTLNTEFAGGFKAVVTMVADNESQPYFEEIFIRFVEAMPQTLARRLGYGLADLVNTDGSINLRNRFSEIMLYRSHLGFTNGGLQPGDIIEVWGEGSSFDGTPEFIDQEGIYGSGDDFAKYGNDPTLARPEYHPTIASFWDEAHECHYVKFYAEKQSNTQVRDSAGQLITLYQPGGYYVVSSLPGNVGDILELTGVNTQDYGSRRFRLHTAVVAASVPVVGYPSTSSVDAIAPYQQSGTSITLTATASDFSGTSAPGVTLTSSADAQVVEGYPSGNYGTSTFMYVQSAGSGSYLDERAWVKFNLAGQIPAGAVITSAKLKLYCWRAGVADMDASVHGATDSWTETGLTWNTQPAFGAALGTVSLANGATGLWYEWDVTGFVVSEAAGDQVVSLVVKPATEGSATALSYAFDAKEYSGGTVAPVLDIQWQPSGGSSPYPTQVRFFYRYAADGFDWSEWTGIGIDDNAADGWANAFAYPNGQGAYEFYTISTDEDENVEDAPVRADARLLFNHPPAAPTTPGIPDGAVNVSLNPTLSLTVNDPDGVALNVSFYDGADNLIGQVTGVPSGGTASVAWNGLLPGTAYTWYAVVGDGIEDTQSDTWTFTTLDPSAVSVPAISPSGWISICSTMMLLGLVTIKRRNK